MQNPHMPQQENIHRLYEFLKRHRQRFSLNSLLKADHFALHVQDMRWLGSILESPEIVELGAGVGLNVFLPAIFCPNKKGVAIEKDLKKVGVMKLCRKELGFHNIVIHTSLDSYIQGCQNNGCQNNNRAVFVKAFSPKATLPLLLEKVVLVADKLYVFDGQSGSLSKLIPSTIYRKNKTISLPYGHHRFVSIFEVL